MTNARSVVPEPLSKNYTNWHFSPGHWADNVLFLSGCTGTDAEGHVSPDLSQQCHAAFAKLKLTLDAANLDFQDVVEITTYHVGLQKGLEIFKSIKDDYIVEPYPAWTAIGVVELASSGAMLEIRAVALDRNV
ncbi:MAG: RidA family protein [Granulosicoccus sp.]